MKRWIFKLAVFLLLGAIVNVAVAWGIATWVIVVPDGGRLLKIEQGSVTVYTWSKPGALRIAAASKEAMETELIMKLFEALRRLDELEREEAGETRRAFIPFGLTPMLHAAARSRSAS